jgi:hypothetical protein
MMFRLSQKQLSSRPFNQFRVILGLQQGHFSTCFVLGLPQKVRGEGAPALGEQLR